MTIGIHSTIIFRNPENKKRSDKLLCSYFLTDEIYE